MQKRAKLPGFRPGKAPTSIIRKQFSGDIRQKVVESLIPKFLQEQLKAENLNIVGTPDIKDVHFHEGEPLRFKAEFEVVPEIELGEYRGVEVPYGDPRVNEEDIDKRIAELREQKAQYVNVDPRPVEDGDHAVVALESIGGVEGEPVKSDEMVLEINGADTFQAFTDNLRGVTAGWPRACWMVPAGTTRTRSWRRARSGRPRSRQRRMRLSPSPAAQHSIGSIR